jgi:transcriptional repressor NrdR
MNCPYCSNPKSKVIDKRDNPKEGTTRRRRECLKCKKRYTTYEKVEHIDLTIIKKDGSAEPYMRDKLTKSILKSVDKASFTDDDLNGMTDEIEMRLLNRKASMVTSTDIGRMVLTRLKKLSPVAYMRFASIYKGFQSIDEFKEELEALD